MVAGGRDRIRMTSNYATAVVGLAGEVGWTGWQGLIPRIPWHISGTWWALLAWSTSAPRAAADPATAAWR